jgi:phosphatidylinositol glycan class O
VSLALVVLAYLATLHTIGLYHFTRGFLLTRLTLEDVSQATDTVPELARFDKAIILVIDALRTDFLVTPTQDVSAYYHDVLTLPAELTAAKPSHSVLFDAYSDPPTTTMQRLKGLTTGSLPTFIDAGANFASTAIEEDSLIHQLAQQGKRIGFMGDDTWTSLFPGLFDGNMTHPFDSFNVEDLHSVDQGVIDNLFPYLHASNVSRWDVLIGHFLGVDHVGHRVGPSSDTMAAKLTQMNDVLTQVVDQLPQDTLLVVLGDHGMDQRGDHGGDGVLETSAGVWMYSNSQPIIPSVHKTPRINQIDLVPTLALALGLPIPFNNLGTVIPDLFSPEDLERGMQANADQVKRYVDRYTGQLDRRALRKAYEAIKIDDVSTSQAFLSATLSHLRELWAQFSLPRIALGCLILFLTLPTTWALYTTLRNTRGAWHPLMREILHVGGYVGVLAGSVVGTIRGAYTREPAEAIAWSVAGFAVASQVAIIFTLGRATLATAFRDITKSSSGAMNIALAGPVVLILHAVSFAANSFIIWEDRMTLFLASTLALLPIIKALTAPMPRLRLKILGFSVVLAVLVRAIGSITVCREEQQPYCTLTFYAHASTPVAPSTVLAMTLPVAWYLPTLIMHAFLAPSRANSGPAPFFLTFGLRSVLTAGAAYWNLEWAETWRGIQPARRPLIKLVKMWLARITLGVLSGAAPYVWANLPLNIEVKKEVVAEDQAEILAPGAEKSTETRVVVYGFANSYGSSYLLFFSIPFAILFFVSQPTAQLALAAALVGLLCHLEQVDAQRDATSMLTAFSGNTANPGAFEGTDNLPSQQPTFGEISLLAVLAHLLFFATGHQAVLSTIQWKTAFIGVSSVVYPVSPLLVAINTFGPFALLALAVPLLALWNVSPRPSGKMPVVADSLQAALGFMLCFATIAFTSALFSAYLRRHLMVWKVFAPRFMLSAVALLVVDVALMLAIGVGVRRVTNTVKRTFKCDSV